MPRTTRFASRGSTTTRASRPTTCSPGPIGRFLIQDRFASASQDLLLQSDPLTQNRYGFAGGNPVNNVEFDGHCPTGAGMGLRPCTAAQGSSKANDAPARKVGRQLDQAETESAPRRADDMDA